MYIFVLSLVVISATAVRCSESEDCVYACGSECASEILGNNATLAGLVGECHRVGKNCDELSSAFDSCVAACHDTDEEYFETCAERASERCYRYDYVPRELILFTLECEELLKKRNDCGEFTFNVTTGNLDKQSDSSRLAQNLRDHTTADSRHLDDLIFLLDLYCWGDICEDFEDNADFYENEFRSKYGGPSADELRRDSRSEL